MAKHAITFVVDTVRDQDILRWLGGQENKSAAIREAIRSQMARPDITLFDVYQAVQDLKQRGWMPPGECQDDVPSDPAEPADLAAALDSLGL